MISKYLIYIHNISYLQKALLCYYISPYDDYLVNSVILLLFNNIFNI
jgi:hypothetical protein